MSQGAGKAGGSAPRPRQDQGQSPRPSLFLALRLALRDLRGGWRGLRIVLACLALGVAAIATVGGLRAAVNAGLSAHGREILGGDLEISGGSQPLPAPLGAWLAVHGARVSEVRQLRSMLIASNGERQLVELKAVDASWPLVGAATATPAQPIAAALADGVLVEPLVLARLGLKVGDRVRLGDASPVVRGVLTAEPDHAATPSILGPRVLIGLAALPATGLIQPGSMVSYVMRIVWPPASNGAALTSQLLHAFPNNGWRVRDVHDAVPGATRFIDQMSVFMSLVGLTSLLVGGIGVATGVRAWLEGRARSIAILRCLGASARMVFAIALTQVAILSLAGILIGVAVGAALPLAALAVFRDVLPVPPQLGVFPAPLALAALFGVLTALAFALPPLARAMRIPGAALFRDTLTPQSASPNLILLGVDLLLAAALMALTVAISPDRKLALGFCVAALATLAAFRLGGTAVMAAARALRHIRSPILRLGLGNLHRPGNATPLMLVALGLGLSTLAAVALIEGNMRAQIDGQLPKRAPSFYFIDIQPDQLDRFRALVRAVPGVTDVATVPNLVVRVAAINGVQVENLHPTPDSAWALKGDRGLTYAATPPAGTKIVAGQWWPAAYTGPPLVSLDAKLAQGWGVKLGDTITVNVLGRQVALRIASLREIDWRTLGMNFIMVASPGLLSGAPHGNIATLRNPPAQDGAVLRAVTDALPNVTGISVADLLASVGKLLHQIGAALAATGSLTLAAGALVLAGAVASGQRRRINEAVILKSLGATRGQIRSAWLVEFGVLGAVAGLLAALIGSGASYAVMHWVMRSGWVLLPATLATTVLGCIVLMLGFGYAGTESALRAKVAPMLRNE